MLILTNSMNSWFVQYNKFVIVIKHSLPNETITRCECFHIVLYLSLNEMNYIILTRKVDKRTIDSHLLETIWTIIPIVILLFIAFPSLFVLYLREDVSKPEVTIKVVGHQWYWEYQYSNAWVNLTFDRYMLHENQTGPLFYGLDVDNRLVLPTLSQIVFLITSADVIHAWTVPSLGVKTDAIPGRLNYLSATIRVGGIYYGQCREICGSNHRFMPIVVEAIPAMNFISTMGETK